MLQEAEQRAAKGLPALPARNPNMMPQAAAAAATAAAAKATSSDEDEEAEEERASWSLERRTAEDLTAALVRGAGWLAPGGEGEYLCVFWAPGCASDCLLWGDMAGRNNVMAGLATCPGLWAGRAGGSVGEAHQHTVQGRACV